MSQQFDLNKVIDANGHVDYFEVHREASVLRAQAVNSFFSEVFGNFRIFPSAVTKKA